MPLPNLADLLLYCFFQEKLLHRNNDFHTTEDTRGITQRAKRSLGKQPDTGMSPFAVMTFRYCILKLVTTFSTLLQSLLCDNLYETLVPRLHGPCASLLM